MTQTHCGLMISNILWNLSNLWVIVLASQTWGLARLYLKIRKLQALFLKFQPFQTFNTICNLVGILPKLYYLTYFREYSYNFEIWICHHKKGRDHYFLKDFWLDLLHLDDKKYYVKSLKYVNNKFSLTTLEDWRYSKLHRRYFIVNACWGQQCK